MSLVLAATPHPMKADTCRGARDVERMREIWCARYDDCVDHAVRAKWDGFSCEKCPIRGTCNVQPADDRGRPPGTGTPAGKLDARHGRTGLYERVYALFREEAIWSLDAIRVRLELSADQAKYACRYLRAQGRIVQSAPGIYERAE